jgi:hypothetical protein
LLDSDGDGISFWANTDGSGFFRLRRMTGQIFKTINPDFGTSSIVQFTVNYPLSYESLYTKENLEVYPNPSNGQIQVKLPESMDSKNAPIYIKDVMGRTVRSLTSEHQTELSLNLTDLQKGMYLLSTEGKTVKLIIE